jgi:membrane associated rhomboid family serine protease
MTAPSDDGGAGPRPAPSAAEAAAAASGGGAAEPHAPPSAENPRPSRPPWRKSEGGRGLLREAPVTCVLWTLCVGLHVAVAALSPAGWRAFFAPSLDDLVAWGAYRDDFVRLGDFERLATCALLHGGVLHLLYNAGALLSLGPYAERRFGSARFTVLVGGSALAGSAALLLRPADSGAPYVCVGLSGGLCGLFAALWRDVGAVPGDDGLRANSLRNAVLLNLAIGLLPRISLLGHAGGTAFGLLIGALCAGVRRPVGRTTTVAAAALACVFGAAAVSVAAGLSERLAISRRGALVDDLLGSNWRLYPGLLETRIEKADPRKRAAVYAADRDPDFAPFLEALLAFERAVFRPEATTEGDGGSASAPANVATAVERYRRRLARRDAKSAELESLGRCLVEADAAARSGLRLRRP